MPGHWNASGVWFKDTHSSIRRFSDERGAPASEKRQLKGKTLSESYLFKSDSEK